LGNDPTQEELKPWSPSRNQATTQLEDDSLLSLCQVLWEKKRSTERWAIFQKDDCGVGRLLITQR